MSTDGLSVTMPMWQWADGTLHPRPQGHDTPDTRARAETIAAAVAQRIVGIVFDPAGLSQIAAMFLVR